MSVIVIIALSIGMGTNFVLYLKDTSKNRMNIIERSVMSAFFDACNFLKGMRKDAGEFLLVKKHIITNRGFVEVLW